MRTVAPSVALLVFALPLVAAPVPKGAKASDFYPTAVGTKWVYAEEDGANESTREVTAATTKDGVTEFTVTVKAGGSTETWELKKDATGVYRTKQDGTEFVPPHKLLGAKPADGDEWTSEYSYGGARNTFKFSRTVGKAEAIKTPAGTYTALPIVSRNLETESVSTLWYADGVGLVKLEHKRGATVVLREFTAGK